MLTVFPNIFEAFLTNYPGLPIASQIAESVPEDVLARLSRIPYFAEAYDEHGLAPEQFAAHPALRITAASFVDAMVKIEGFAERVLREA